MIIVTKKQDRENSQSLVRRFAKTVQRSGILRLAKANRFHKRSKSRQAKRRAALRREELKKEYEKLRKLGKLER